MSLRNAWWWLRHARFTRIDPAKKYIVALTEPITPEILSQMALWLQSPEHPLLIVPGPVQIVEAVVGTDKPAEL